MRNLMECTTWSLNESMKHHPLTQRAHNYALTQRAQNKITFKSDLPAGCDPLNFVSTAVLFDRRYCSNFATMSKIPYSKPEKLWKHSKLNRTGFERSALCAGICLLIFLCNTKPIHSDLFWNVEMKNGSERQISRILACGWICRVVFVLYHVGSSNGECFQSRIRLVDGFVQPFVDTQPIASYFPSITTAIAVPCTIFVFSLVGLSVLWGKIQISEV